MATGIELNLLKAYMKNTGKSLDDQFTFRDLAHLLIAQQNKEEHEGEREMDRLIEIENECCDPNQ